MEKKVRLLLVLLISFVLISSSLSFILADDKNKIKKTYSWVKTQSVGEWQNLNVEEEFFSLLILKSKLSNGEKKNAVNALILKSSNNGMCWPANCDVYQTSLAKILLFSLNNNTFKEKYDAWLLGKTMPILSDDMQWYLQIIQDGLTDCELDYNYNDVYNEYLFTIEENGEILGNDFGSCFTRDNNMPYWLKLNNDLKCLETTFNLTCNESFQANFIFKKNNEWHVTSRIDEMPRAETLSLNLTSNCISLNNFCDYKSTLWAAYAFFVTGDEETARGFLPYLIMEQESNEKYFPETILYALTGQESYADKINLTQGTDGLFNIQNGECKYYNSALARFFAGPDAGDKINSTKLDNKLILDLVKDGTYYHWQDSNHNLRDSAMLLWAGVGSGYLADPQCIREEYSCVDNCSNAGGEFIGLDMCGETTLECCNLTQSSFACALKSGTCKSSCSSSEARVGYSCDSGDVCCKPYNISLCASEIGGTLCIPDIYHNVDCLNNAGTIIPFIQSGDANYGDYCCKGTCILENKSCADLQGIICTGDQSCGAGGSLPAIEDFCCLPSYCTSLPKTCVQGKGGKICNSGEDCKNGNMVDASDTGGLLTCCINGGSCVRSTCDKTLCLDGETCDGSNYNTMEGLCCDGSCIQEQQTCLEMNGQGCTSNQKCSINTVTSKDVLKCCTGTCKEKKKFDYTLLIIIAVIIVFIVLIFFLIKKLKKKNKKKDEFGFDEFSDEGLGPKPGKQMPISIPAPSKSKTIPAPAPKAAPRPGKQPILETPKKQTKPKKEDEDTFEELEKMSK